MRNKRIGIVLLILLLISATVVQADSSPDEEAALSSLGYVTVAGETGHKDSLKTLSSDFVSKDGATLHALVGSTTAQNGEGVIDALSENYDSGSADTLKLVHGDFVDAEKWNIEDGDPWDERLQDDSLCWAASVSNVLWSSGWAAATVNPDTGSAFTSEDETFTYFNNHFGNKGGEADCAFDWFFNGTYLASGVGGSPWIKDEVNMGRYTGSLAELIYETIDLVDNPENLSAMNRLSSESIPPAFEASVGPLIDGAADKSTHSMSALGLITDPSAATTADKYKAILLADPDNDGIPTISEECSDAERIADRAARLNSYTIYPLKLITDQKGKKCWQLEGYSDPGEISIIYDLVCLPGKTQKVLDDAAETDGSCDVYSNPDFLISDGLTSPVKNDDVMHQDEPATEFKYGDAIYFTFFLKNKGVEDYAQHADEQYNVGIRFTIEKDGTAISDETQTVSLMMNGPDFEKKSLQINGNTTLGNGTYTVTAEVNPKSFSGHITESYYRNNKPIKLSFSVSGGPEPAPKQDSEASQSTDKTKKTKHAKKSKKHSSKVKKTAAEPAVNNTTEINSTDEFAEDVQEPEDSDAEEVQEAFGEEQEVKEDGIPYAIPIAAALAVAAGIIIIAKRRKKDE